MMKTIRIVIKKDLKEYLRFKKNIYYSMTLMLIGSMVILTTLFFPTLIAELGKKAPDFISNAGSINELMEKLFPDNLRGSLGIWYSDVGIFYSVVLVLTLHGLLPNEIKNGKWIMPLASGYTKVEIVISKIICNS